jgi:hypothetical protein
LVPGFQALQCAAVTQPQQLCYLLPGVLQPSPLLCSRVPNKQNNKPVVFGLRVFRF